MNRGERASEGLTAGRRGSNGARGGRLLLLLALIGGAGLATATSGPAAAEHASAPVGAARDDARRLSLGNGTACVILDNGQLRCWGTNNQGQTGTAVQQTTLGRDETPDRLPAVQLGTGRSAVEAETGSRHGCALLDDGAVRCWGRNVDGAVGVPGAPSTGYSSPPTAIDPVSIGDGAIAIAVGGLSSCAILDAGSVRCWGAGGKGVNGLGDAETIGDDEDPSSVGPIQLGGTATAITVGRNHACAILAGGSVRCWGDGAAMPLHPPGPTPPTIGDDELPTAQSAFELGGRPVTAISAASSATCGINDLGDLYCWGSGVVSRLATGNTTPEEPTKVDLGARQAIAVDGGVEHACVVLDDGSIRCWGSGGSGRLGYGDENDIGDDEPPTAGGPVALGAGRTAKAVSAGLRATCALLDNDTVRCWGDANEIGSGQPFDIGDDELPTAIPPVNYIGTAAFRPLSPARILDTRESQPSPAGTPKGFVAGGTSIDVAVTGIGGVPDDDVYAVVLNVTIARSGGPGFVTAYPKGVPEPTASNINVTGAGQTAPNLVVVPVGDDGEITLSIGGPGGGHLIADVFGYYEQTSSSTSGRLIGVSPSRVFDTRPSQSAPGPKGKIPAGGTIEIDFTGTNGVPAAGVSAVVMNLTGAAAEAPGFVTAYPGDESRPDTSNVNLVAAGATRANSVIVPVGPTGTVKFYALSSTHLLADVTGYYTDDSAEFTDDGLFVPLPPARLLDTRTVQSSPVPANGSTGFAVTGKLGIPSTANAVVLNLTATRTGGPGFVTGWPSDESRPGSSSLNYLIPNTTIANLAILPLSQPSGRISLFTLESAHLIADTSGYHL
jgi:alpha-tubulin suppressor-like RCC1 family protein